MDYILTFSFAGAALISLFVYVYFMAKRPTGYSRKPLEVIMMILTLLFMGGFIYFVMQIEKFALYIMIGFGVLALLNALLTFLLVSKRYQTR